MKLSRDSCARTTDAVPSDRRQMARSRSGPAVGGGSSRWVASGVGSGRRRPTVAARAPTAQAQASPTIAAAIPPAWTATGSNRAAIAPAQGRRHVAQPQREAALLGPEPRDHRPPAGGVGARAEGPGGHQAHPQRAGRVGERGGQQGQRGPAQPQADHGPLADAVGQGAPGEERDDDADGRGRQQRPDAGQREGVLRRGSRARWRAARAGAPRCSPGRSSRPPAPPTGSRAPRPAPRRYPSATRPPRCRAKNRSIAP